jgi:hypothetical protein
MTMRMKHKYSPSIHSGDDDEEGGFTKEALDAIDDELDEDLDLEDDSIPTSP